MTLSTTVTDVQHKHVTIRKFNDRPVSDELVTSILEAARRGAPTSSNRQTYSMIVVRNPNVKKELAVVAGGQEHVETCQVFIAFCADIRKLTTACEIHNVTLMNSLEATLVSTVDAALVGMSVNTAAESFGLGAVMIGAMRNDVEKAAKLLGLPKGVYCVFGMCLGWPDENQRPPQKPRLPEDVIIHYEQYKTEGFREAILEHNKELADHYNSLGNNKHDAAWTWHIANQLQHPRRPDLREKIENQGFSFS